MGHGSHIRYPPIRFGLSESQKIHSALDSPALEHQ